MTTISSEIPVNNEVFLNDEITKNIGDMVVDRVVELNLLRQDAVDQLGALATRAATGATLVFERVKDSVDKAASKLFLFVGETGLVFMRTYTVEQRGFWISSAEAFNTYKQALK